jgi:PAS domain S-box-containing protein
MALPGSVSSPGVEADVLDTVFQNVSEGVLVINRLRKVIAMNPAASQITGWKQRDLTSINCNVFQSRNEQGKPTCAETCNAQRVIESGQALGPMYLRITRADGTTVSTEATYIPMRFGDRSAVCVMLLKDITVLEHFDQTVRSLNQEIAEKNIVLRGFSEQMSVAWRAAMIDLRAGAEGLRARHSRELGDTGMRALDRMVRATQKLEATFAQLKSQIQATLAPARRPPPQA